jgi:hypothetical protein
MNDDPLIAEFTHAATRIERFVQRDDIDSAFRFAYSSIES